GADTKGDDRAATCGRGEDGGVPGASRRRGAHDLRARGTLGACSLRSGGVPTVGGGAGDRAAVGRLRAARAVGCRAAADRDRSAHRDGDPRADRPARLPALPPRRLTPPSSRRRTALCAALALALVAGCDSPHDSGPCDGICPVSPINHLVVIVQENHTFDTYFGRYCTAATGSAPTCTDGPACCERAPDTDPGGASPIVLDDHANALYDPNHLSACEADEVDGGKMDHFVDSTLCGDARNFAYADASTVQPYWDLAAGGALADHWFQPVLGQSSSNDMFLFNAHFVFADNGIEPDAPGAQCSVVTSKPMSLGDTNTLGDKLDDGNITWTWYAEGFADMLNATARPGCPDAVGACCPDPPPDCGAGWQLYPCVFDPDDIPAAYYKRFAN